MMMLVSSRAPAPLACVHPVPADVALPHERQASLHLSTSFPAILPHSCFNVIVCECVMRTLTPGISRVLSPSFHLSPSFSCSTHASGDGRHEAGKDVARRQATACEMENQEFLQWRCSAEHTHRQPVSALSRGAREEMSSDFSSSRSHVSRPLFFSFCFLASLFPLPLP